ncbi:MAG TPA: AAA family ATPase [Mycobacterium sp.]|jgi:aminoglycoside phosphotransferase family enzyme/adenylate kinase family enzyme|nr:AAA family ATPase [Mycobacterium sp.]
MAGDLDAQVHETHTGVVILLGEKAYKVKKPVITDFLDFSTLASRQHACEREVMLNRRLAPQSYLGVAQYSGPAGELSEPVIEMRRYPDATRLASLVEAGEPVLQHLCVMAEMLAQFHREAARGPAIEAEGRPDAISARWHQNLAELEQHGSGIVERESVAQVTRMVDQFIAGRAALFQKRLGEGRIIDGHGDLLADDIFCVPEGPALLDCLEFDDQLRYIDGIDDVAFLAMDLEFLGRPDLGDAFVDEYRRRADDPAPTSLTHFYVAYRAVVRAKVDCIRVSQGHHDARAHARRHIDIALKRLRLATVRLILVGGGPGTGKTTLSKGLSKRIDAQVISTDDTRRQLRRAGSLLGIAGGLDEGLYSRENVAKVYDEVLRQAGLLLRRGTSVILDGTWRDQGQRERARKLAAENAVPLVELTCSLPLEVAATRIEDRAESSSDATPQIAAALETNRSVSSGEYHIDTGRPLAESVAEAQRICVSRSR